MIPGTPASPLLLYVTVNNSLISSDSICEKEELSSDNICPNPTSNGSVAVNVRTSL